jgi:hypothetical protein
MKTIPSLVLCFIAVAGCADGERVAVHAASGKLSATCNWNGECLPDLRFFSYDGPDVDIRFIFVPAVEGGEGLAPIQKYLRTTDVEIAPALLPKHEHSVCGQSEPLTSLTRYEGGVLSGSIEGTIRLCRTTGGDILDDTGIDPIPFTVTFDLTFDPREKPPASGS